MQDDLSQREETAKLKNQLAAMQRMLLGKLLLLNF